MAKARTLWGAGAVVTAGCLLAIAGFSPQLHAAGAEEGTQPAAVTASGLQAPAEWQGEDYEPADPRSMAEDTYVGLEERAEAFPAKIVEYEDGTRVQRTPTPAVDSTVQVRDYVSWNTYRLNADNRGCLGCHDDLAVTANNIGGYPHPDCTNSLGIEWTEFMCSGCHVGHFGTKYDEWAELIHGIHTGNATFDAMGGDCWSCHAAATKGETTGMVLWDDVKYTLLHGISAIAADDVVGEFAYDQDVTVANQDVFAYEYLRGRTNDVATERWGRTRMGLSPTDGDVQADYEAWAITIGGEVQNPVTLTLAEIIENFEPVTTIIQYQCVDNGGGGSFIANMEITGVPVSAIMDYVGVTDAALSIRTVAADGGQSILSLEEVAECGGYLFWEIDGQPLTYKAGYPCAMIFGGGEADQDRKVVVDIEFEATPAPANAHPHGCSDLDGNHYLYPGVGICYLREGQIIDATQPFTFQGYAAAIHGAIADIEISFDHGKTWQTFETPNNDPNKWTWWTYTWTPPADGWYTIAVRATTDDGTVSFRANEMMVCAQTPAAEEE